VAGIWRPWQQLWLSQITTANLGPSLPLMMPSSGHAPDGDLEAGGNVSRVGGMQSSIKGRGWSGSPAMAKSRCRLCPLDAFSLNNYLAIIDCFLFYAALLVMGWQ